MTRDDVSRLDFARRYLLAVARAVEAEEPEKAARLRKISSEVWAEEEMDEE